ncbi:hypothetical protein [Streptomyces hydrogenans]|uniref:hypothetical protein n=1 Tax=Streptomyces hydrogenans TaxID=1873719 RepID=UPI00381A0FC8
MQPTLLDRVAENEALSLAGPDADVFPVPGATVALGATSTVIVAKASDDPAASGVWNAEEFRLIGPAPAPVTSRLMGPMPFSTAGAPQEALLHLFVRLDDICLYLGVVQVSMCEAGDDVLSRCDLRISPPLKREILDLVRPAVTLPPLPGLDWLSDAGANPGKALEGFATGWYPESDAQAWDVAMPDFIPGALADFYRLAARRPALMGSHNRIVPMAELRAQEGAELLVFGVECQGGWTWSIPRTAGDTDVDPCVRLEDARFEDHRCAAEQEPLSGFLLQFALKEAAVTAPYVACSFDLPRRFLPRLESCLQRVRLQPFLAPIAPTDFLVAPGLVATVTPGWDDDKVEVRIGAGRRSALHPLVRLDIPWRSFDG